MLSVRLLLLLLLLLLLVVRFVIVDVAVCHPTSPLRRGAAASNRSHHLPAFARQSYLFAPLPLQRSQK